MALRMAALVAGAMLMPAPAAQAAFVFDRTDADLSAGTNQRLMDVAIGDLDRASGADVVASAAGDNKVYLFRNQGGGRFAAPVGHDACGAANGSPNGLLVAQLNTDGLADVATACSFLTVLPGNGSGGLLAPVRTSQASRGAIAAAELTGAGGVELVTGAPGGPSPGQDVLCFTAQPFGPADSRCGNPLHLPQPLFMASTVGGPLSGTPTPFAANFTDAPGARYDEIVAINPDNPAQVSVYGRDPGFGFDAWSNTLRTTSAPEAYFVDVGDLEQDDDRDLLVGHRGGGVFDVFVWDRDGILPSDRPKTTATIGGATLDGAFADFDGDELLDVVVAGARGRIAIHRGNGNGTFGAAQSIPVPAAPHVAMAIGNLGGDRKPDIALGTAHGSAAGSDQVTILLNRTQTAPPGGGPGGGGGGGGALGARLCSGTGGLRSRLVVPPRGRVRLCRATNPPTAVTTQKLTVAAAGGAAPRRRRVVIGSGRTRIPAGSARDLALRLNAKGRRLLRKRGRLRAQLAIAVRGPAGRRSTVTRAVRLTAKRPGR